MKIIVYNYKDQYALSRKQVEKIAEVIPKEYFDPIQELHLTHSRVGQERFEYLGESKQVHFCFPIEQKTADIINEAVSEFLVGLARIKSNTRWGYFMPEQERNIYQEFVEKWHPKCIAAIT